MNLLERLLNRVTATPTATAIIDRDSRAISFASLERESAQLAALIKAKGVRRGDAVLVLVPMSIELYVTLAAVLRIGAIVMILDPAAGLAHIERCCRLNPPCALVGVPVAHLLSLVSPGLRRIPIRVTAKGWFPFATPWNAKNTLEPRTVLEPGLEPVGPDAPALLTFTSGTGGAPKAALRSHGLLLAQLAALETLLGARPRDVDLATLPIVALANLATGVTTAIPAVSLRRPSSVKTAPILAQMAAQHVTRTAASPALLERLADAALMQRQTLPGLTRIFSGGGPVFPRVLEKLARIAPNARIVSVYGSTEAEPIAHIAFDELQPSDLEAMRGGRGLLVGAPVPEIELRILPNTVANTVPNLMPNRDAQRTQFSSKAALDAASLGPDSIGEIVVTGPHVLPGYLGGIGDEETKFRVDTQVWHRTGDAGYLDERGRLWLVGRASARIRDARGELYPFSVECAATQIPGVRRCALLQHRDQRLLCVEWTRGAARDEAALLERLEWAQVDAVRSVPSLPMDARHNAKVDLKRLRELLEK